MGSGKSKIQQQQEFASLEKERDKLRRAREEHHREALRLETEKKLFRRAHEDLSKVRQLEEELRRLNQSKLYPNLNHTAGSSINETYQTNAAADLTVNHDHFRYQPSAPPAPVSPTFCQPSEARAPPPWPRPPTTVPGATAPQAATVLAAGTASQAATNRASVTAPQAATVRASGTAPQAATVRSTGPAPQAATVRASVAAPREKKGFTWKDDNQSCQTCKKPYEVKIFQCKNGHSACELCWSLDVPCGQCNGPITNRRNFGLEEHILANRPVKCPNAADGCRLSFKKHEFLTKHEKKCPFKELECPSLENCNWRGKLSQLTIHFDEEHPSSRQANVDTEMSLPNICNEQNSLQLIKLGTYNFLFYVKVSETERCVYMDIQLIGTKMSASKWHYEIHVYNKRQPRRKYQYVNSCHSSNDTQGICLSTCAVLPLPYARSFYSEGNLNYKIFIKRNFNVNQN